MIRLLRPFLLACAAAALAACVSTSVTPLVSVAYPESEPESIRVFFDAGDVPGPYEELALIETAGSWEVTEERDLLARAREEAAEFGANGLIVKSLVEHPRQKGIEDTLLGSEKNRKGEMVAIFYRPRLRPARADAPLQRRRCASGPEVWTGGG